MDYQKIYNDICSRGQIRQLPKNVYTENHHIIPKCLGGNNEKSNLTKLTAREHFLVHYILAEKINPKNPKLWLAFWTMCSALNKYQVDRYIPSSRIFEYAKMKYIENKPDISGANNPMYGKEFSQEAIQKLRDKRKLRVGERAPNYGKSFSDEWKKSLSDAKLGEKNNFFGKQHTDKTKEILRQKAKLRPPTGNKAVIDENGIFYKSRKEFMEKTKISEGKMYILFKLNKLKNAS